MHLNHSDLPIRKGYLWYPFSYCVNKLRGTRTLRGFCVKKKSPVDCFLAKVVKSGTETQSVWVDEQVRREATVSLKIHQRRYYPIGWYLSLVRSFLACRQDGFKHRTSARFHLAGTLGLRNNSPDCCVYALV